MLAFMQCSQPGHGGLRRYSSFGTGFCECVLKNYYFTPKEQMPSRGVCFSSPSAKLQPDIEMQIPFSPPGRWQVAREGREGRGEGARNRGVKFKLQRKIWRNVCV